jgi:hypothetical protein
MTNFLSGLLKVFEQGNRILAAFALSFREEVSHVGTSYACLLGSAIEFTCDHRSEFHQGSFA